MRDSDWKTMRNSSEKSSVLKYAFAFIVILAIISWLIYQMMKPPVVYEFELAELSDGIYAYRETVVSSVPAENYTMVTVCDIDGNMFTVKGTVNFVNQTERKPYAVFEDYNMVNSDVITIYATPSAIQYLGTVRSKR